MNAAADSLGRVLLYAAALLVVVVSVYPFVYMLATSFKTGNALFSTGLLPDAPTLAQLRSAVRGPPALRPPSAQLGAVATATVALSLLLAVTAAYALGRIRFRGKGTLLLAILAVSMFPQVAVLSGMFELMRSLGLYNRAIGLVLPYTDLHAAVHGLDADHLHARAAAANWRRPRSWTAAGRCASSSRSSCRCCGRRWCPPGCWPSSAPGTSSCSR